MTTLRRLSVFSALLVFMMTAMSFSLNEKLASTTFRLQNLNVAVDGTSTLHDWTIKSAKGQCEVNFELASDKLTGVSGLNFYIPAESLKSGNNMMDNNTYKALKTKEHKNTCQTESIVPANSFTNISAKQNAKKRAGVYPHVKYSIGRILKRTIICI